jgi:hypothetical protein
MFSGDFLLSPFSVNDSCYGSDGDLFFRIFYTVEKIRAIFVCFAELRRKILPVQIRAQIRNHICASCIHDSYFY